MEIGKKRLVMAKMNSICHWLFLSMRAVPPVLRKFFCRCGRDYGIGKIVGTTTYGKGVVQELRQLRDGSAVKLTVSNYYTPKGNSINKVGMKPDIEVKLASELLNKTEISHEEDNQLQEALKTLQ